MKITVGPQVGVPRRLPKAEPAAEPSGEPPNDATMSTQEEVDWHPLTPELGDLYEAYVSTVTRQARATRLKRFAALSAALVAAADIAVPKQADVSEEQPVQGNFDEASVALDRSAIESKLPIVLCEFLAYQAALAYEDKNFIGEHLTFQYPAFTHVEPFDVDRTGGYCFLFQGRAHIIFRGTTGITNWYRNFQIRKTRDEPARHVGFVKSLAVAKHTIEQWIAKLPANSRRQFVFCGHSLGGAMAMLAAYDFHIAGRDVAAVATFGAPAVGTDAFVRDYDERLGRRTWRIESSSDIVPRVCGIVGYKHAGRPYSLKDDLQNYLVTATSATLNLSYKLTAPPVNGALGYARPGTRTTQDVTEKLPPWAGAFLFDPYVWIALKAAALGWLGFEAFRRYSAHRVREQYAYPLSRAIGDHLLGTWRDKTGATPDRAAGMRLFEANLLFNAGPEFGANPSRLLPITQAGNSLPGLTT